MEGSRNKEPAISSFTFYLIDNPLFIHPWSSSSGQTYMYYKRLPGFIYSSMCYPDFIQQIVSILAEAISPFFKKGMQPVFQ